MCHFFPLPNEYLNSKNFIGFGIMVCFYISIFFFTRTKHHSKTHTHRTHILMLRIKHLLLRFCSKFIKFSSIRTEMYFVRAGYLLTQNTHTWFNTCHAVTKSLRSEKKEKKTNIVVTFMGHCMNKSVNCGNLYIKQNRVLFTKIRMSTL